MENEEQQEQVEQAAPDGLMAQTALENEETEEIIPHKAEDAKAETEEVEKLERPEWLPEKFWNDEDGPELEKMAKNEQQC